MKNIEVVQDYDDHNIMVFADENMLRTSLRNILSNAVKFNKTQGKIRIQISKKGGHTIISIEDTGIGMDNETIENLFTYSGAHQHSGTSGESSSGLGLFLTKDFLEKNDISVQVKSKINIGTTFELTI